MPSAPNELENEQVKQILHVICSPRGRAGESSKLSRTIVNCLFERERMAQVVERVIGCNNLPHIDGDYALSQASAEDTSQQGSMIRSEELIRELESSDYLVIGTPMHNFTVPSTLKAWVDHVVRVRRTFDVSQNGKVPLLRDRPVFVAISSGGRFSGTHTRQPDFLRPYLKAIFGIMGLHDLSFFSVEGTVAGPETAKSAQLEAERAVREHLASLP